MSVSERDQGWGSVAVLTLSELGVVFQGLAVDAMQAPEADSDPASSKDLLILRGIYLCWRLSEQQILVDLGCEFLSNPLQTGN